MQVRTLRASLDSDPVRPAHLSALQIGQMERAEKGCEMSEHKPNNSAVDLTHRPELVAINTTMAEVQQEIADIKSGKMQLPVARAVHAHRRLQFKAYDQVLAAMLLEHQRNSLGVRQYGYLPSVAVEIPKTEEKKEPEGGDPKTGS